MHSSTNINCTKLKSTGETATHARVFAQLITAKVDVYNEKHFGAYYTPNGRTKKHIIADRNGSPNRSQLRG